jgi:hypothetical protein
MLTRQNSSPVHMRPGMRSFSPDSRAATPVASHATGEHSPLFGSRPGARIPGETTFSPLSPVERPGERSAGSARHFGNHEYAQITLELPERRGGFRSLYMRSFEGAHAGSPGGQV